MTALDRDGRQRAAVATLTMPTDAQQMLQLARDEGIATVWDRAAAQDPQCGYCSPGFILAAKSLLDRDPAPDRETIRRELSGNLCRCTGYQKIYEAVELAAERIRHGS